MLGILQRVRVGVLVSGSVGESLHWLNGIPGVSDLADNIISDRGVCVWTGRGDATSI